MMWTNRKGSVQKCLLQRVSVALLF